MVQRLKKSPLRSKDFSGLYFIMSKEVRQMEKIRISDITLKQIGKRGDNSLSFKGKLEISKLLDKLEVSVIRD